ncbi:MAG: RNA-binding domain-containing protein [Candidatus Micrarchaeota archaeon]
MKLTESQHAEFKESLANLDAIVISVVAFANNGGGKIYIGIKDDGTIKGIDVGKNTIENLAAVITKNTETAILPRIYIEGIEKKIIIVVEVEESSAKPHFYRKIAYKRVGKSNIQMDILEIKQMILDQSERSFDESLFEFDLSEINTSVFNRFLEKCKQSGRLNVKEDASLEDHIEKLGALKERKVKLGFLLMFAQNPTHFLPHFGVKLAKISSQTFSIGSLERSIFYTESIFRVIDEIVFEIVKELPKRVYLDGSKRIEEPIIPTSAIREFVANALVHCDYRIASSISILLTPTCLEISNPGRLMGLKIQDLYKKHRSILRNPFLARLMFLSGDIEEWGSGIENANIAVLKSGLSLPQFNVNSGFFSVRINFGTSQISASDKIIKMLKAGPLSSKQIAKKLDIADRTVRAELKKLVDLEAIKKQRKGRKITYKI